MKHSIIVKSGFKLRFFHVSFFDQSVWFRICMHQHDVQFGPLFFFCFNLIKLFFFCKWMKFSGIIDSILKNANIDLTIYQLKKMMKFQEKINVIFSIWIPKWSYQEATNMKVLILTWPILRNRPSIFRIISYFWVHYVFSD